MSLANLISLLALVILVEGGVTQWRKNYTICNTPNCSSVELETARVGQALGTATVSVKDNQTVSGSTILADSEDGITCPHWMFPTHPENGSTACECGDNVRGAVLCNSETQKVEVHKCYCMTYSIDNTSLVVGKCWYGCYFAQHKRSPGIVFYYPLPSNISQVCDHFHRDGQLCSKCKDGFAPPVYSYDPSCVNCTQ